MTTDELFDCVLLADRHHALTEGMRGLLETMFKAVVMVADEFSLHETASRLRPELAVVDVSLARDAGLQWLRQLRQRCPDMKVIALSIHDEPSARRVVMDSGVHGFVLTRAIATDLLPAIQSALADTRPPTRAT